MEFGEVETQDWCCDKAAGIMSAKYDTPNQTKPKELQKVKETMTREEVETLILAACTEERNMYNWKIRELEREIMKLKEKQ